MRQPRSLGLTLAVALMCVLFWRLGLWQWHRAETKRAQAHAISQAAKATPVAPESLLSTTDRPAKATQWRRVQLSGSYDSGRTVLLRNRTLDGQIGYEVFVPLVPTAGAALLIDRGFVPAGAAADSAVDVPPPPTGVVTTVARVRIAQRTSLAGLRFADIAGKPTVGRLDVARLSQRLAAPYELYDAYAELLTESPSARDVPAPQEPDEPSDGLNLAYAVQWWIFCGVAVAGWWILLRRDTEAARAPVESDRALLG